MSAPFSPANKGFQNQRWSHFPGKPSAVNHSALSIRQQHLPDKRIFKNHVTWTLLFVSRGYLHVFPLTAAAAAEGRRTFRSCKTSPQFLIWWKKRPLCIFLLLLSLDCLEWNDLMKNETISKVTVE